MIKPDEFIVALPKIANRSKSSFVMIDPKETESEIIQKILKEKGYEIKILDLATIEPSIIDNI